MKSISDKKPLIESNLNPRPYTEKEVCRIINPRQHGLYIKHKVYPIDMYSSIDDKGMDIVVYIYLREDTKELYQKWLDYELK